MPIVCSILDVYLLVIFLRIILSWFPVRPGSGLATAASILYDLTEPVLGPVRRMIPSVGMFDVSPIVVILALRILSASLCTRGAGFL